MLNITVLSAPGALRQALRPIRAVIIQCGIACPSRDSVQLLRHDFALRPGLLLDYVPRGQLFIVDTTRDLPEGQKRKVLQDGGTLQHITGQKMHAVLPMEAQRTRRDVCKAGALTS